MALKSMRLKPPSKKDLAKLETAPDIGGEVYPWGLRLHLGEDELEKLGLSALPDVGTALHVTAVAEVVSASESRSRNGRGRERKERSVELQITKMDVDTKPKTSVDAVDKGIREARR